jgi:Uma2 family endonuclease
MKRSRKDYYAMADAGILENRRIELIHGEVIEMPPVREPHAAATTLAALAVQGVFGTGFSVRQQQPLRVGDSEPEPDVAVVPGGPRDYVTAHPSTGEFVIEVAESSLDFDLSFKAELYARAGVPEYWVIDLRRRCVEVLRQPVRRGGRKSGYSGRVSFPEGSTLATLHAPRKRIRVRDLLP